MVGKGMCSPGGCWGGALGSEPHEPACQGSECLPGPMPYLHCQNRQGKLSLTILLRICHTHVISACCPACMWTPVNLELSAVACSSTCTFLAREVLKAALRMSQLRLMADTHTRHHIRRLGITSADQQQSGCCAQACIGMKP